MRVLCSQNPVNFDGVGGVECGYEDEEQDDEACSNEELRAAAPAVGLGSPKDGTDE